MELAGRPLSITGEEAAAAQTLAAKLRQRQSE
jgi:hypothetical protein